MKFNKLKLHKWFLQMVDPTWWLWFRNRTFQQLCILFFKRPMYLVIRATYVFPARRMNALFQRLDKNQLCVYLLFYRDVFRFNKIRNSYILYWLFQNVTSTHELISNVIFSNKIYFYEFIEIGTVPALRVMKKYIY